MNTPANDKLNELDGNNGRDFRERTRMTTERIFATCFIDQFTTAFRSSASLNPVKEVHPVDLPFPREL